jgi:FkbM family methyltransferase
MDFSHQWPLFLAQHVLYDRALPRIISKIGADRKLNIIDVGANIGDTVALIKSIKVNVSIMCIEGNKIYASFLQKNYADDDSIIIEEVFCSDVSELKNIRLNTGRGTAKIDLNALSDTEADFLTLDEIVKRHPEFINIDFIKIDTDGFDYKVLRGSTEILQNHKPYVFFELDKSFLSLNGENIMSIFDLFKGKKYEGFILYDNYGYLVGLFDFTDLDIVGRMIDYMESKKMYLDVLMVSDIHTARDLYKAENESIKSILNS